VDGDFAGFSEAAVGLLHLRDAVEAHGDYREAKILREEADAGLEFGHAAVGSVVDDAFGKNEEAVKTVGGFAGELEAVAEAGKLREGKNVEERGDQPIVYEIEPALGSGPAFGRMAHFLEGFAAHGGGEAMAESAGNCGKDEANIGAAGDVIGDDERGCL